MSVAVQRGFPGGEISPSLHARVDLARYQTGLKTCRNWIIRRDGAATTRPGSEFLSEVKDSTKKVKLIPFIFNNAQTYVLEFGHLYIRFYRAGAPILETGVAISGITNANPAVVTTAGAHGYSNGDEVVISGVLGMTQVNGRQFKVAGVTGTTFELRYMDNATTVNSALFGGYVAGSADLASRVYTLVSTYTETDMEDTRIKYVQSRDVITLANPKYKPRELARISDTNWTLTDATFIPGVANPVGVTAGPSTVGTKNYKYRVTAVHPTTFEESLPGREAAGAVATSTNSIGLILITTALAHGYTTGDEVIIAGNSQASANGTWGITFVGATTFTLNGSVYVADGAGGTHQRTHSTILSASLNPPPGADFATITIPAQAGITTWNVYRADSGVYGYVGSASAPANTAATYIDYGYAPDFTAQPPTDPGVFASADNFPSAVAYHQQRIAYANSDNEPDTVRLSRIGNFKSFSVHSPIVDDDAITFALAGRQANRVKHLLGLRKLLVFTTGSEYVLQGNGDGVILPTAINPEPQSYNGSSDLPPLVINDNAIYVQERGAIVRDLSLDDTLGYQGADLTTFASHLVAGKTLDDWTYQQAPHSVGWMARSDGTLLGMTYVKEQEILAWHRHDFASGLVEEVCAVPEGDEWAVYLVVKYTNAALSTIGGSTRRYVLRMATRFIPETVAPSHAPSAVIPGIASYVGMDYALSYDGHAAMGAAGSSTLTGGTNWASTETLTLTTSDPVFTSDDVGKVIWVVGSDGTIIKLLVTGFTGSTIVTGRPHKTVPVGMRSPSVVLCEAKAVNTIGGLWHMNGEYVSVFGDGFVEASPKNASHALVQVVSGVATLSEHYATIHGGLPILADIETLDIDTTEGGSLMDRNKLIPEVIVYMEETRGLWAGQKAPDDDTVNPLQDLREMKVTQPTNIEDPPELITDKKKIPTAGRWDSRGHMFLRQVDPVPATILAWAPSGLKTGRP